MVRISFSMLKISNGNIHSLGKDLIMNIRCVRSFHRITVVAQSAIADDFVKLSVRSFFRTGSESNVGHF